MDSCRKYELVDVASTRHFGICSASGKMRMSFFICAAFSTGIVAFSLLTPSTKNTSAPAATSTATSAASGFTRFGLEIAVAGVVTTAATTTGGHAPWTRGAIVIRRPLCRVNEGRIDLRRRIRTIRFEHEFSHQTRALAHKTDVTLSQSGVVRAISGHLTPRGTPVHEKLL